MTAPVVELLADVQRLGIKIVAQGYRLRFAPRDRMPAELIDRLRKHKDEVLAAITPTPNPFAGWVRRPDIDGRMGWEPPDLPETARWWSRIKF